MKKFISGLVVLGSILTSAEAFSTGVYTCYSGGHKSIFTLLPLNEAILQEYGRKEYDGLWQDYNTRAKVIIEKRKTTEYRIESDKNRGSNIFIISTMKNNSKHRFCKAKHQPLD
ncbi:MAG: hypothetical protein U9Q30_00685 [Campylobacterota bacterium]|nr:hypothetical protein [Campylobacterota bacterium]